MKPFAYLLPLALLWAAPTLADPIAQYTVQRTAGPIKIDGHLDEFAWEKAEQVNNFERILNDYDQVTRPGQVGADASPLSAVLTGASHRKYVDLPDAALRSFYLWLDAHVPFYGTDQETDLAAQRLGRAVPPPPIQ